MTAGPEPAPLPKTYLPIEVRNEIDRQQKITRQMSLCVKVMAGSFVVGVIGFGVEVATQTYGWGRTMSYVGMGTYSLSVISVAAALFTLTKLNLRALDKVSDSGEQTKKQKR